MHSGGTRYTDTYFDGMLLPAPAQNSSGNLVVPLVIHIVSGNPDFISDQQIMDAIANLNGSPLLMVPGSCSKRPLP